MPLSLTTMDSAAIEQKIEAKTNAQISAQIKQSAAQLQRQNQDLAQRVSEMTPTWKNYTDNFQNKIRIGTLFYGDYRFYTNTGFQPQELTQLTNPGPGNNNYNSFDVTRTYLNFFFMPTTEWEFRLTPNMPAIEGSGVGRFGAVSRSTDRSTEAGESCGPE